MSSNEFFFILFVVSTYFLSKQHGEKVGLLFLVAGTLLYMIVHW